MAYSTRILNIPLGASCQDQHDAYAAEKARVSQLAAQLGQEAANCHKLHGNYDKAAAKNAAAAEERSRCAKAHQDWMPRKAAYDAYMAYRADCVRYLDAKKKYVEYTNGLMAQNVKLKADYEKALASVQSQNANLRSSYMNQIGSYQTAMTVWNQKNAAYTAYKSAVQAQAYSLGMQWSNIQQNNSAYTNKYNWPLLTNRCDHRMRCVTKAWKLSNELKCTGVKGLGALGATLPDATTCQYYHYYPVCPDSCPPFAPHPGTPPTQPGEPTYLVAPKEPTYNAIPTLGQYLQSKGIKQMPDNCGSTPAVADPGSKPSCDPNAALPAVPPRPTCTPPNIPPMPVAPSCKTTVFGQVGPMWLLLAAGGVGLYWYAKKK